MYARHDFDVELGGVVHDLAYFAYRVSAPHISEQRLALHLVSVLGVQLQLVVSHKRQIENVALQKLHARYGVSRTVQHNAEMLERAVYFLFEVLFSVVDSHSLQAVKRLVFMLVRYDYLVGLDFQACLLALYYIYLYAFGIVYFKPQLSARFVDKIFKFYVYTRKIIFFHKSFSL